MATSITLVPLRQIAPDTLPAAKKLRRSAPTINPKTIHPLCRDSDFKTCGLAGVKGITMSSYPPKRASSPGSRKLQIPGRSSGSTLSSSSNDPYSAYSRSPVREEYVSPRSSTSGVVVPISSETYITYPANSSSTRMPTTDTYSGRPRRSTLTDFDAPATLSIRRPTAAYQDSAIDSAHSPPPRTYGRDTYIKPAQTAKREHKRLYSVDDGKSAELIAETEVDPRDSHSLDTDRERGGERRSHHLIGSPTTIRGLDDGYSYTNAEGMYRDTEPRQRRRRGSVDRGLARPTITMDPDDPFEPPPRASTLREGPPPSTRGNLRDPVGSSSKERHPTYVPYNNGDGNIYDSPRRSSSARHDPVIIDVQQLRPDDKYPYRDDYDDHRESRPHDRFRDDQVEARGFGIRSASVEPPRKVEPPRQNSLDERFDSGRAVLPPPPAPVYRSELAIMQPNPRDYIPSSTSADGRHSSRDEGRRSVKEPVYERERDWDHERRRDHEHKDSIASVAPAAAAATAAAVSVGAGAALNKSNRDRNNKDRRYETEEEERRHGMRSGIPNDREDARERHYTEHDRLAGEARKRYKDPEALDPDEDYRRRVQQQELELAQHTAREPQTSDGEGRSQASERRRLRKERPRDKDSDGSASSDEGADLRPRDTRRRDRDTQLKNETSSQQHSRYDTRDKDRDGTSGRSIDLEAGAIAGAAAASTALTVPGAFSVDKDGPSRKDSKESSDSEDTKKKTENRVRIVEPSKSESPPPSQPIKSILRKPTEKFPEDPNPIREGVAPLKDAKLKDKNIPSGARWTKISRDLVNPQALSDAQERFEERQDCVIVLRVLTREEIEALARRTREIRGECG